VRRPVKEHRGRPSGGRAGVSRWSHLTASTGSRDAASTPQERPLAPWTGETLRQAENVMSIERVRLQPYVDAPLAKQLAAYSAATGKTTSFVVQAALRQYLDRTDDKMLLLQRLNRLGRAWDRTQRDLEIHMEAFAIYVKLVRAHPAHRRQGEGLRP
jgi:hypothetical protein